MNIMTMELYFITNPIHSIMPNDKSVSPLDHVFDLHGKIFEKFTFVFAGKIYQVQINTDSVGTFRVIRLLPRELIVQYYWYIASSQPLQQLNFVWGPTSQFDRITDDLSDEDKVLTNTLRLWHHNQLGMTAKEFLIQSLG